MCSAFGVLGLVWWTAGKLGRTRQTAVALVALNPLVLVYGLGAQHNDPLMLLALVGAVALAVGGIGRRAPGGLECGSRGVRRRRRGAQALGRASSRRSSCWARRAGAAPSPGHSPPPRWRTSSSRPSSPGRSLRSAFRIAW